MNPFFGKTPKERFARTVLRHCMRFNLNEKDPEVQREWFGRWVVEDANFVYHVHRVNEADLLYADARWLNDQRPNDRMEGGVIDLDKALADLPARENSHPRQWFFGLGTDLGYEPDPFAYVLWAWTPELPDLFEVASWKQIRLIPDAQAKVISEIGKKVPLSFAGADAGGGGKGIVRGWAEGWQDRYPIPIEEAPKSQKVTAIEFLNNDIRAGHVKLRRGGPLYHEMCRLTWGPQRGLSRRLENVARDRHGRKRNPNDCCDGGLYGHRMSQHHRYTPPERPVEYGSEEYWRLEEARIEAEINDGLAQDTEGLDAGWQRGSGQGLH